jgi:haloacetate dehalogenase
MLSVNASPDIFKKFLPPLAMSSSTALASYGKNFHNPACVHAMCEDYRASSPGGGYVPQGPDYALDKSDLENEHSGRRVKCDLMVLWGDRGIVGKFWDVKKEWRKFCVGEVVGRVVDCGHYIPEGEHIAVNLLEAFHVLSCRAGY